MRAAVLRELGKPPQAGEFDEPRPAERGQEVVEVLAAGLNPVDLAMASGSFYAGAPPLPSVVGREGIGRLADGTIAYFDAPVAPNGSMAERSLIYRDAAIPLPEQTLDPALAVAFGIAGLAGWLTLEHVAKVRDGEVVLVLGASGTVGRVAVQSAKLLGAGRVVAATRSAKNAPPADAVVEMSDESVESLAAALVDASGGDGYDVVVDPVWGKPAAAAAQACRRGARLVNLGQSAGATSPITSASIRSKPIAVLGHTNLAVPPIRKREAFERMISHAAAGQLSVPVERIPLAGAADAWARQATSPRTKLVIVP